MTKTAKTVAPSEVNGKTISGVGHDSDRMLIAFTDGTVLAMTAEGDCDDLSIEYEWTGHDLDLLSGTWSGAAEDAGLITHDEWLGSIKRVDSERVERLRAELAALESRNAP